MLISPYDEKADAYAGFGNGPLARAALDALPQGGAILDVGCAHGGLLAACAGRAGRRVGIEVSGVAAAAARRVADEVVEGDVSDPKLSLGDERFDVVVLGDVVEHLAEPERALARARAWLRPGGRVVVSVPNVAFWEARLRLLAGRWDYERTGIFDSTHLRFFTRAELHRAVAAAGFEDVRIEGVVPRLGHTLPLGRLPAPVRAAVERAWQRLGRRRIELFAFQLIGVGRRSAR
jgi:methionine biosynthesis protein MetW